MVKKKQQDTKVVRTHAHKIYIDGDYDEDRGISEKDCEEMEYACSKAGIKCKCEPDEMRQGGVIVHTMAPRDEVIKALDAEGYSVEESSTGLNPEGDFADAINNINPKHDEAEQDVQKVMSLYKRYGIESLKKPELNLKLPDGKEHTLEQAIKKLV